MNTITRWEPYAPVSIGLEDMFRRLDAFHEHTPKYPPYNIVKLDDERQELQVALAGFTREEIEVAVERKVLNISVSKTEDEVGEYVHKGVAKRSFSRNWQLSADTVIDEVTFVDGLLRITLRREIPEADRRKVLPIS